MFHIIVKNIDCNFIKNFYLLHKQWTLTKKHGVGKPKKMLRELKYIQYVAIIYHRFLQEFLWENSIDPIQRGRSTFGRQKHKRRRIERGHNRIMDVYFDLIDPLYDEEDFCQCF
jgi:hypothetical protein